MTVSKVKIEHGIPLPVVRPAREWGWPFPDMQVGDSFAVPDGTNMTTIRGRASYAGMSLGKRFSVRRAGNGSFRCWRLE